MQIAFAKLDGQAAIVQVRDLNRRTGIRLDRTERLANSLGHLCKVVSQLTGLPDGVKVCQMLSHALPALPEAFV